MKRLLLAVMAVSAVGCGVQKCKARSGQYRYVETRQSGTCAAAPPGTMTINGNIEEITPPCTGSATYSDDNCVETIELACPADDGNGTTRSVQTITWSEDAKAGAGVLERQIRTSVNCDGVFAVSYNQN